MRLADICEINPKADSISNETVVSFVAMQDVSEDGKINTATVRTYQEVKKGFTFFREGDVLLAKITPCMENGKGALAVGLENGIGCGSTEFHVIRPKTNIVNGAWLYYLTAWPVFRAEAEKNMTGSAGQKRVPKAFLEKYEVDLPSLDTQKQQLDLLNRTRHMIDLRRKQLTAFDDLIKARFVEMFGDPISSNQTKYAISEIGKVYTGNTPSMKETAYYESDDIPFIKPGDIAECAVTKVENTGSFVSEKAREVARIMPAGSVLVTCIGTIGKVGISAHESCCNQQINFIVPNDNIDSYYLAYTLAFCKPILEELANAPVVPIINKTQFSAIELPIAAFEKQKQFKTFVRQVNKSKLAVQKALNEALLLFDTLMQQFFGSTL